MKKIVRQFILVLSLAALSNSLQAMDLQQVTALAIEQDINLQIARSQLDALGYTLPQAKSAMRPQINLGANASYSDSQNALLPDDRQTVAGYSLNLQQSLYSRKISAQVDAASANIEKAQTELKAARQSVLLRVTEAYFNILSAQDNVAFAKAEKNAIGRQLEQAKKRFEVGLVAITDVKEAQASYDSSLSQEILAINGLDNAREALGVIIGHALSEALSPLGDELVLEQPQNSRDWVAQAQQFNLNVLSAQAALKAANHNRRIARADGGPTLKLLASYQDNRVDSDRYGYSDGNDLTLSVQLDMPLYSGGRTRSTIAKAEAEYTVAQNNLRLQQRLAAQQTRTAYLAVVSGMGQVNALKQVEASSQAALEATQAGFDVGTRTSVEVLNSLRNLYRARRDYASARYSYLVNKLKLKQSVGQLEIQDVETVNRWLR